MSSLLVTDIFIVNEGIVVHWAHVFHCIDNMRLPSSVDVFGCKYWEFFPLVFELIPFSLYIFLTSP